MISALYRAYARFRGFDLTGATVPPMDGPLRPNTRLDAAPVALALDGVDNLADAGDGLLASVGTELLSLAAAPDGSLAIRARRDLGRPVTAIATGPGGLRAIAVEGARILITGPGPAEKTLRLAGVSETCITAMAFESAASLVVAVGSAVHPASEWKRDLMTKGATGSLWRVAVATGEATRLAGGLAFPAGVAIAGDRIFVSEAWRHRVSSFGREGGAPSPALAALPAYPGRIAPAAGGGLWLALFAPRNPLVEFVLGEDGYRQRMVDTIDPDYWIAPSLLTGRSFLEPIQGGARKKLNMLKPWSPTWSAGLVARCDAAMQPQASFHSRADGTVHGVTALAEHRGRLYAGAKGSGKIVALDADMDAYTERGRR